MPDKPTPQPKPTNSQATQPVESPLDAAQQPPKSIRSNLMSGQVESAPIISEAAFAQPGTQKPAAAGAADAKPAHPAHLKGRHSKLVGLLSVMGLLLLASVALFFTYRSYQASYQKVQKSRVSNSIAPTNVDLGGLAPTSTTLQGVGLLQVNGDANITNSVTANSFSGGGADLSNLNATNITSGTLNDARLSPNVALLNANQAFTGSNSFGGSSNFTGAVVLPGTMTINSLTYNMPGSQAAGTLSNDGAGNLIWQAAGACPTCVNTGGNSFGAAMSVGTNDPFDLSLRTNGITRLSFDTAGNATFAGTIVGNGSGITNLNGSNISSGTVADARLTSNVTLQGNLFNGAFQLVQLGAAGQLPALNGAALTNLDASNISAGTLSDSRLSANVTLQGNTFNAANKLVQLNGTGGLPALNGSLLTALNASNISSGTVADARLSTNVALLNANQTFSGTNAFSAGITTNTIASTTGLTVGTTSQSLALQGNGSTTLASNSGGFVTTVGFSGAPVGNVNYNFDAATAAGTYGICTTVGNCASSGGGVTTLGGTTNKVAKFTGLQSIGDGSITDTGTQVTTQSTSTDSATAFRVLNAAGTTTAFNVDTTNTRIGVGTATPSYAVDAVGDINASNGLWVAGNQVCNNTGCIAATGSGFYINNGTGTQATANFNIQSAGAGSIGGVIKGAAAQTANLQEWQNSAGTTLASVSAAGNINTASQYQVAGVQIASSDLSNNANLAKLDATQSFTGINTFQNTVNSTGAFKIQNAAGSSNLLVADTTNTRIGIGTASPGYTLDVNGDVNISTGSLYRINGVAICGATGTCAPSALSTFYIQNGTGQQASANFNIVSTATGSITGVLQGAVGQTADLLSLRAGDGTIVAGFSNVGVLTLGNDNGTPQAGSIVIHDNTGSNTFTSTIGTAALTASRTITFPNETGTVCTTAASSACNSSSTGYFQNGGNSFGTGATLGTNDAQALAFETGGTTRFTVDAGAATLTGTGATTLTSSGAMTLNSAAGSALAIGATSTTGSIGIGAAITTGAITIGGAGNSGTVDIRTTNGTSGALNLQTGNNSTITIQTGTNGNLDLLAQTVNIANTTGIKNINLANSTGANVITIGGTGANVITIGNTQTGGSIAMGAAMTSGTIALGGSSMTTGNINLTGGTGAGAISLQAGTAGTILLGTTTNNAITTGTGVLTVAGDANLNGNTTIGNATSDRLTVTSQILGATPLAFQGLTDNAFYTSFAIADPTGINTVTFRDAGGTVCFESSANCGFQLSGSYFAQGGNSFGTLATLGTNDAQALAFETGGTTRFTVDAGAATLNGTGATTLTSSGAMTLNSAAGSALNVDSGTTGAINIGTSANAKSLTFGNTGVASTFTFNSGATTTTAMSLLANSATSGTALAVRVNGMNNAAGFGVDITSNFSQFNGTLLRASTTDAAGTANSTNGFVYFSYAGGTRNNSFVQIDDKTTGNGSALVLNAGGTSVGTGSTSAFIVQNWAGNIKPLTVDTLNNNIIPGGGIAFTKETAHTISVSQSTTAATDGAALSIVAGQGSATTSGSGGQLNLTGGAAAAGASNGGAVAINGGTSIGVATGGAVSMVGGGGFVGGAATVSAGGGLAGGGLTLSGGNGSAGTGGAITITAGTGTTTPGSISMTTTTSTTSGFTFNANSNTSAAAMTLNVNALTSGKGLEISTSGIGLTGNMLSVTSATTGNLGTTNGTSGAIAFNLSGAHTGYGFQLRSATQSGTVMRIDARALTTGVGLDISATTTLSTGNLLKVANTSAGAYGTTAGTSGAALFSFGGNHTGIGFQVYDSSTSSTAVAMQINAPNLGSGGVALAIDYSAVSTTKGLSIRVAGVEKMYSDNNGTLFATSILTGNIGTQQTGGATAACFDNFVGYNFLKTCASSIRYKENVQDLSANVDDLMLLRPVEYDWKSSGSHDLGIIAEEAEAVNPLYVVYSQDANGLSQVESVKYEKLVSLLIKGYQAHDNRITALEQGLSTSVLQSIASANAITINGSLTINGITIFNGATKFNGDITVNQDGAGEATIVAGASSVDVVFSKELAAIPVVTASPQDFNDGQYKITSITKAGFTVSTSISQTADAKFSWTAVQK